jgi:hypothetical protein
MSTQFPCGSLLAYFLSKLILSYTRNASVLTDVKLASSKFSQKYQGDRYITFFVSDEVTNKLTYRYFSPTLEVQWSQCVSARRVLAMADTSRPMDSTWTALWPPLTTGNRRAVGRARKNTPPRSYSPKASSCQSPSTIQHGRMFCCCIRFVCISLYHYSPIWVQTKRTWSQ